MTLPPPAQASNRDLYLRLTGYIRPYWRPFVLAMLGMVGTAYSSELGTPSMEYMLALEMIRPTFKKTCLDSILI